MSKRKTVIELQNKPENKAVRQIVEKTKPVDFAPISPIITKLESESGVENETKPDVKKSKSSQDDSNYVETQKELNTKTRTPKNITENKPRRSEQEITKESGRLRIFQASTPITRTLTKFQKAAIVVRSENGKELIELLWRDQMNEKTRDIWDYLSVKFVQAEEELSTNEVMLRKRDILEGSGVKSDRTFISAIYTLEDMGLIEVKRLSGNKEGNIYILTAEGKEEIDNYRNSKG